MRKTPAIDVRKHPQGGSGDMKEGNPRELSEERQDGYPASTPYLIYGAYPLLLFLFVLIVVAITAIREFL